MLNDPQLDVDEAPKGAQYKVGDMVFTCDNDIMVVEDVQFIGSVYNGFGYEKDDPKTDLQSSLQLNGKFFQV